MNTGPDNFASALVRRISELRRASFPRWIRSLCCVVQVWSMTVEYSFFLESNTCLLAYSLWHLNTSHLPGAEFLSRMKVIYCDTTDKCYCRITWRTLIRKGLNARNASLLLTEIAETALFFKPQCGTNLVGLTTYKRLHTRVSIGRLQLQWTEIYQNPLTLYRCIRDCLPRR